MPAGGAKGFAISLWRAVPAAKRADKRTTQAAFQPNKLVSKLS